MSGRPSLDLERIEWALRQGPPDEPRYRPGEMRRGGLMSVQGVTVTSRSFQRPRGWTLLLLLALVAALVLGGIAVGRLRELRERETAPISVPVPRVVDVAFDGADGGRTGRMPGPAPDGQPVEAWHIAIPSPSAAIAVADGLVVAGDLDGNLHAIDVATRTPRWTMPLGGPVTGGIAIADGTVFVASGDGRLHAVDLHTGSSRWSTSPAATPDATPVVVDDLVVFGRPQEAVAVDATTGEQRWAEAIGGSGRGTATDGTLVYVAGETDGRVFALDAQSGARAWEFDTGFPNVSTPVVDGGVVYVTGQAPLRDEGRVFAIGRDHQRLWSYPAEGPGRLMSSPATSGRRVVVTNPYPSQAGTVAALDVATGEHVWSQGVGGPAARASIVGDMVFATAYGGTEVYALDDGEPVEAIGSTGNGPAPVVSGGLVFLLLQSDDPAGSGLWVYAAQGDPRRSPPAVAVPSLSPSPVATPSASAAPIATLEGTIELDDPTLFLLELKRLPNGEFLGIDVPGERTGPATRIVRLSADGRVIGPFGAFGAGPGQFDFSEVTPDDGSGSISIADDGWIAVGDGGNHRVQLFDPKGSFARQIRETDGDAFVNPCCVGWDHDGHIVVMDDGRGDVSILDRSGALLRRFGSTGSAHGQFRRAGSPSVDTDGRIFIPNFGNRRGDVFTPDGEYLRSYGDDAGAGISADEVNWAIADEIGRVYLGDTRDRILVFADDGRFLGQIGPDIPGAGRIILGPILFLPDGKLLVGDLAAAQRGAARLLILRIAPG